MCLPPQQHKKINLDRDDALIWCISTGIDMIDQLIDQVKENRKIDREWDVCELYNNNIYRYIV